jgi:hypothetical protein
MKAFTKSFACLVFFFFWLIPLRGESNPLFWQATKDGKSIYLLGTIHIGSDDLYPLPDVVYDALDEAEALFVEVDIRDLDTSAVMTLMDDMSSMPDASLFDLLDSETWFSLDQILDKYQIQLVKMDHKQPWYFVYLLSGLPASRGDYDPELGVDIYVMDLADRKDVPVCSLETMEYQLSMFADWSLPNQVSLLKETLEDGDASMDALTGIHDAWKEGDAVALMDQEENSAGNGELTKAFFERIIDQRNHGMLQTLLKKMERIDTAFVAVGAMHMIGEQGLVTLLRENGYTVSQLSGKKEEVAHD